MAAVESTVDPPKLAITRPPRETTASWPLADRLAYLVCWATGIGLCAVALTIVLFMFIKGAGALRLNLFVESPSSSVHELESGGFRDPLVGTMIVAALGVTIAAPLGVGLAVWRIEYGRPRWLARALEAVIETIAGIPSIVLALFGLLLFARGFFAFLSGSASNGSVSGQSFLIVGIMMSVLALPLTFGATREALEQLPPRLREASYALGKTRATTIRRVLLPSIRPGTANGTVLGLGRIIGDTAIPLILLGATLKNQPVDGTPLLGTLRGTGSTLTNYVYSFSPAGEGNAPLKAYAAAFVLLMIVLALNGLVTWQARRGALHSTAVSTKR